MDSHHELIFKYSQYRSAAPSCFCLPLNPKQVLSGFWSQRAVHSGTYRKWVTHRMALREHALPRDRAVIRAVLCISALLLHVDEQYPIVC